MDRAALSACSLPSIPTCPGTQEKRVGDIPYPLNGGPASIVQIIQLFILIVQIIKNVICMHYVDLFYLKEKAKGIVRIVRAQLLTSKEETTSELPAAIGIRLDQTSRSSNFSDS
ncbi:hypothetical protein TNCV_3151731 [Trichonephila clavipes]|nr:hypothetical protein TNCV_3151731 [Trichonephila clavipes]